MNFLPYTKHQLDYALRLIYQSIYTPLAPLEITLYRTQEPVPYAQRTSGEELHLQVGDSWGELFDCAWFHFTGQVPAEAAGQNLVLLLDVSGEMCVFDAQGVPVRGLTSMASDYDLSLGGPGKRVLPLFDPAQGGELIDVWADAGANDLFGNLQNNGRIVEASIAVCHPQVRVLFYDFEVLLDLLKVLPEDSARYAQILTALNEAMWLLASGFNDENAAKARQALAPMLAQKGGDPSLHITAIGHAHIDLGWLWPIRETHRKGARTFATVLANMERYPSYVFGASQPQLFQWIKEDHPELYARIKQKVKEGRFEPQGAMWVEADTNLTGGESLVRQLLYGTRFFQDEFGLTPRYLWLPDVFGYSAALPQMLKKAGVDYFMTQKMSWNQVNKFPHHSFLWQGIDGSQVPTHMLPEETYNSSALPRALHKAETNYFEKGLSDQALLLFGIGDGGGGPGEEHLERLERLGNLAGLPPLKQGWAADFFETWQKDSSPVGHNRRFPAWVGELYLERHAGTLTTEAKNKAYNRRLEQALRELEFTASLAGALHPSGKHKAAETLPLFPSLPSTAHDYPSTLLERTWKEVLLYQFHDILPGSSIKRVYDESLIRYAEMLSEVQAATRRFQEQIAAQVHTAAMASPLVCFNSLSWERTEWVKHGEAWLQLTVPPLGYAVLDQATASGEAPQVSADPACLENEALRLTFAPDGSILSILDKQTEREFVTPGQPANVLRVYADHGDAWDFPLDYASQTPAAMQLTFTEARLDGPRPVLKQIYQIGYSQMEMDISLVSQPGGNAWVEFDCRLSWREPHTMLRTSFPVNVHADLATFEIQFGSLQRPTHRNTTWDLAKDEVAAHKFADLSQADYGAALLNDSKYGYKVKDGVIDLNLLRSVPYPRPTPGAVPPPPGEPDFNFTDQAEHSFRYAFYPHAGDVTQGKVVRAGYEFNHPLQILAMRKPAAASSTILPAAGSIPAAGSTPAAASFLQVDQPNLIVETVKQAEDGQGWILRLYECAHASARAALRFGFPIHAASETDLLERELQKLPVEGNTLRLSFKPFEIKTVRVG